MDSCAFPDLWVWVMFRKLSNLRESSESEI